MSTKSHSSSGDGNGRKSTANNNKINNTEIVEDKTELINKTQISHSGLSDPDPSSKFNNTNSEKVEGEEEGGRVQRRRRRRPVPAPVAVVGGGSNFDGNHCLMEIDNPSSGKTTCRKTNLMMKTSLREVSNCLTTSKELLRVLNHVWMTAHEDHYHIHDQPSSTLSVITALKSELDRAKNRVDHLIKDQSLLLHDHHHDHGDDEIVVLMKRFVEEKATMKYRERARVRSVVTSMADEVEVEKKLRRQAERLNKTISKELAHAKLSLSKALKDLQREKRAKEIFEEICDELAKGIGEDRAEFEVLKKESLKVREEVEKEREMLQLADVLREERVQMKLSEAKFHFEEKNAAVEKLKDELETYLQMGNHNENGPVQDYDQIKELEAYLKKINFGSISKVEHNNYAEECEEDDEEEEEESDLQSIELNMDNNSKSYRWSFVQNDKDHQIQSCNNGGRKSSASDKIQWGSICLNRKPISSNTSRFDWERFTELFTKSNNVNADNEITAENKSTKCLGDILFPVPTEEDQNQVG